MLVVGPALQGWGRLFLPPWLIPGLSLRSPRIALSCERWQRSAAFQKKKGKSAQKAKALLEEGLAQGQQRLLVSLRSILMLQARVQARQPPLMGEKRDLNQRELGRLFPALRGLCCSSRGHPPGKGLWGAQPSRWDQPGCREWSQHPGKSHFTSDRRCCSFGMEHTQGGREGERGMGPSAQSSGDEAKEQAVGTFRWLCPVPAPPRGPRVAAMPRTRSDRSSRAVNALNSQGFGSSHSTVGAL